jgi:TolB protein
VWSPDGQKIAFHGASTGLAIDRSSNVHVINADGTERTRLTDFSSVDGTPDWSPDGSRIVFTSDRRDGRGIYVMDADGSDVVKLTDAGDLPAWSPDGLKIAYTCGNDVCVMNSDGTGSANLTNTGLDREFTMAGSWSPDGTKILYTSDVPGRAGFYVMNADGTSPVRLNSGAMSGAWSPDGTKIVVSIPGFTHPSLYYMNADGTGLVQLTEDGSDRAPSWSSGL